MPVSAKDQSPTAIRQRAERTRLRRRAQAQALLDKLRRQRQSPGFEDRQYTHQLEALLIARARRAFERDDFPPEDLLGDAEPITVPPSLAAAIAKGDA